MKTTYSVEYAGNMYNDDYFNGSYEDCLAEAKKIMEEWKIPAEEIQIALVELDDEGCVTFTHEVVKGTEF